MKVHHSDELRLYFVQGLRPTATGHGSASLPVARVLSSVLPLRAYDEVTPNCICALLEVRWRTALAKFCAGASVHARDEKFLSTVRACMRAQGQTAANGAKLPQAEEVQLAIESDGGSIVYLTVTEVNPQNGPCAGDEATREKASSRKRD